MSLSYNPAQLVKGARAVFMDQTSKEPPSLVGRVATYIKSESRSEDYAWIGEATQLAQQDSAELPFTPLSDAQYNLINTKHWAGLELKRDDVDDDEVGGFLMRVRQMAQVAARYPNKLITNALINGTSATLGLCYAGEAFFTATHAARGSAAAYSNLIGSGAGTTVANIQTDLGLALAALQNMLGENGEPINEGFRKVWVMIPPALQANMSIALFGQVISQTSNVGFKDFEFDLIPNARLSDANDWYIGIADQVLGAIIFQDRRPITFTAQDNEENDASFIREVYRYKTVGRMVAGYGRPQACIKVVNT